MSRRQNAIPSVKLTTMLPEDLHSRVTIHLHSDLEGRIPHGAWAEFLCARIREYFDSTRLDLSPYLGCEPGVVVSGTPSAIRMLVSRLKESRA